MQTGDLERALRDGVINHNEHNGPKLFFALGFRPRTLGHALSAYAPTVVLHAEFENEVDRLISVVGGALTFSKLPNPSDIFYPINPLRLNLPKAAACHFSVSCNDTGRVDEEATRAAFGLTFRELESLAVTIGSIAGRSLHPMFNTPRVTH